MTPYDQPPIPIPVYDRIEYQYWRRDFTKPHRDRVFYPAYRCPPFLIVRASDPNSAWTVTLKGAAGVADVPITVDVTTVTIDGTDYAWPDLDDLVSPAPAGRWYMELSDGVNTYYSEWFNITDCYTDKVGLLWRDNCEVLNIPYGAMTFPPIPPDNRLRNFGWIMLLVAQLTEPEITTEHQENDTGEGTERLTSITATRYLIDELLTPYQIEALHGAMHHRQFEVREHLDVSVSVDHEGELSGVSSEVVGNGCQQLTELRLKLRADRKTACCDGDFTPAECYPTDALFVFYACEDHPQFDTIIFGLGDPIGTQALINGGAIEGNIETNEGGGTYAVTPLSEGLWVMAFIDAEASITYGESGFLANGVSNTTNVANVWFVLIVSGSPSGLTPVPVNARPLIGFTGEPDEALLYIDEPPASVAALNRFVELWYCDTMDGDYAPVNGSVMTEQEFFSDGYVVRIEVDPIYYRLRYYTHTCEYGFSRARSV